MDSLTPVWSSDV